MGRKTGNKSSVRRMAKTLSVLMASAPVMLQTPVYGAAMTDPIGDMYLEPGKFGYVNLVERLGLSANDYSINTSNSDIASYTYNAGWLTVNAQSEGVATFTVTVTGTSTVLDTFNVKVIDPGPDGRIDIGDTVRFMNRNKAYFSSPEDVTGMVSSSVKSSQVVTEPVPTGDGKGPSTGSNFSELSGIVVDMTKTKTYALDHFFTDADQPITYTVGSAEPYATVSIDPSTRVMTVYGKQLGSNLLTLTATDRIGMNTSVPIRVTVTQSPTVTSATYQVGWPGADFKVKLNPLLNNYQGTLVYEVSSAGSSNGVTASIADNGTVNAAVYFRGSPSAAAGFTIAGYDPSPYVPRVPKANVYFTISNGSTGTNPPPTVTSSTYDLNWHPGQSFPSIRLSDLFHDTEPLDYQLTSLPSMGLTAVISSGNLIVSGVPTGSDSFTVTATDHVNAPVSILFRVAITNSIPVTVGSNPYVEWVVLNESYSASKLLGEHFTDADGDTLQYTIEFPSSATSAGLSASIGSNGTPNTTLNVAGVPSANASFGVSAKDGLSSASKLFTFNVDRRPQPAGSVVYNVYWDSGDTTRTIPLQTLLTDPDSGDTLTYQLGSLPSGSLSVTKDETNLILAGSVSGTVSFTLNATDSHGFSSLTPVTLNVIPNNRPTVSSSVYNISWHPGQTIPAIQLSDLFHDTEPLSYQLKSSPGMGLDASITDGRLEISGTPEGDTSFTVEAADSVYEPVSITFQIQIVNEPPVALGGSTYTEWVAAGESYSEFKLLSEHFSDADGDTLFYKITAPSSGTSGGLSASIGDNETPSSVLQIGGTPTANATFTVGASDGMRSAVKTFSFQLDHRPQSAVTGNVYTTYWNPGTTVKTIPLQSLFTDEDQEDTLSFELVGSLPSGGISVSENDVDLTISGSFVSPITVSVQATDSRGFSSDQPVDIHVISNQAPNATGGVQLLQSVNTGEPVSEPGTPYFLSSYFSDLDGEDLVYTLISEESNGVSASIQGTGSAAYVQLTGTPTGTAAFTVTGTDRGGLTAQKTFKININPVATDGVQPVVWNVDQPLPNVSLSSYFTDTDPLTYTVDILSSSDLSVNVVDNGTAGASLVFTPGTADVTDFSVTGTDPDGAAAVKGFEFVANHAPTVLSADEVVIGVTSASFSVSSYLTSYFHDSDGEYLTYTVSPSQSNGVNASIYPASGGYVQFAGTAAGTTTFTITGTDQGGLTAQKTFKINVRPTTVTEDTYDIVWNVGSAIPSSLDVSQFFTDTEPLASYEISGWPESGPTYNLQGATLTFSDMTEMTESFVFTVRAIDQYGETAQKLVSIHVNHPPEASEGIMVVGNIMPGYPVMREPINLYDFFYDDGELSYEVSPGSLNGVSARVYDDGAWYAEFTGFPTANAAFTVTATDEGGLTAQKTFKINLNPTATNGTTTIVWNENESLPSPTLSQYFSDSDPLTYTVEILSSASDMHIDIANNGTSAASLVFTPGAAQSASFSVTAKDADGGTAVKWFEFYVNHGPELYETGNTIMTAAPGYFSNSKYLTSIFYDSDSEELQYSITPTDSNGVTAAIQTTVCGTFVQFEGTPTGTPTFTITATDRGGLTAQKLLLINVRPSLVDEETYALVWNVGSSSPTLDLSQFFVDTEPLVSYSVSGWTEDESVMYSIDGSTLSVEGLSGNTASFSFLVRGEDAYGQWAEKSAFLYVNQAPTADAGNMLVQTVTSGNPVTVQPIYLGEFFSDDDMLIYEVSPEAESGITATIFKDGGYYLRLEGTPTGTATFTVEATDMGGLTAQKKFIVNVAPSISNDETETIEWQEGAALPTLLLSDVFSDSDSLNYYTSYQYVPGQVNPVITGDSLGFTGSFASSVTDFDFMVYATDPYEAASYKNFRLSVTNRAPETAYSTVTVNSGRPVSLNLTDLLTDYEEDSIVSLIVNTDNVDQSKFESVNIAGAILQLQASPDTTALTEAGYVTVTVTDSAGSTATRTIRLYTNADQFVDQIGTYIDLGHEGADELTYEITSGGSLISSSYYDIGSKFLYLYTDGNPNGTVTITVKMYNNEQKSVTVDAFTVLLGDFS